MSRPHQVTPVFERARALNLHTWAWSYVYGTAPEQEGGLLGSRAVALGANGVVIDAEAEWENGQDPGPLIAAVRKAFPGAVYLSSYASRGTPRAPAHPNFAWDLWLPLVDGYMPQVYSKPQDVRARRALADFTKANGWRHAAKNVILTGLADPSPPLNGTEHDIRVFLRACAAAGAGSCNFWVADHATPAMWQVLADEFASV